MRSPTRIVVAAVAGAALGAVGVAVVDVGAAPDAASAAGTSSAAGRAHCDGAGMAFGHRGMARHFQRRHRQWTTPRPLTGATTGRITAGQKVELADIAQDEKLAHDLYVAFAGLYDDARFDRISASETQHLIAVRALMTRYRVTDPTGGTDPGEFSAAAWQDTYDELLATGSTSEASALGVGATVERIDIADLRAALEGPDPADVERVYGHLLSGSRRHLQAFTR